MDKITSVTNNLIKNVLSYKDGKSDFVFLDGEKAVKDAIKSGVEISTVFIMEKNNIKYDNIILATKESFIVSDNVMNKLSSLKTPQGIIALARLRDKPISKPSGNFLVLDNIQDPGNLGTIIRTAKGANFTDIYCINCATFKSDKVVRSSMSAIFDVNLYMTEKEEVLQLLKKWNVNLVCADMNGKNIFNFIPPGKCGLVLGSEGQGVSKEFKDLCSEIVSVPMANNLESLNVSVSAGILMYLISKGV